MAFVRICLFLDNLNLGNSSCFCQISVLTFCCESRRDFEKRRKCRDDERINESTDEIPATFCDDERHFYPLLGVSFSLLYFWISYLSYLSLWIRASEECRYRYFSTFNFEELPSASPVSSPFSSPCSD